MQPLVLVVETDAPKRAALRQMLEEAGYACSEAADGPAALEMLHLNLARKRPHRLIVLLNPLLPGFDGTHVLRVIAEDPHLATHHVYILLAEDQHAAVPEGASPYAHLSVSVLPAPFAVDMLLDMVAQAARGLGMEPDGAGRRD